MNIKERFKDIRTPFTRETVISDASDDDTSFLGFIEGYAATNFKDRYGDIISAQALIHGAEDLLANPTVFQDHDYRIEKSVGRVISAEFRSDDKVSGIWVKVGISKTAKDLWTKVKEGIVRAFSIGGVWDDAEFIEEMDGFLIKDMELYEMSIVGMPANPTATFGAVAKNFVKSLKEKKIIKENKSEGKDIMGQELEKKLEELESKMASLDAIQKSQESQTETITKITDVVTSLAETIKPLIEDQRKRKSIAERESALIKEREEKFNRLSYRQKLRKGMQEIISAIRDSTVEEVVLLGNLEPLPPIYERDLEELNVERRRIGAV